MDTTEQSKQGNKTKRKATAQHTLTQYQTSSISTLVLIAPLAFLAKLISQDEVSLDSLCLSLGHQLLSKLLDI